MRELIDYYQANIKGDAKQQANAHTLAELARYRNSQCRRRQTGTFAPSGIGLEKEQGLGFIQMVDQEGCRRQPKILIARR